MTNNAKTQLIYETSTIIKPIYVKVGERARNETAKMCFYDLILLIFLFWV